MATAKLNYHRRNKSGGGWLLFLVLLLLLVSGATLAGWFLFGQSPASGSVKLVLEMSDQLTAGQLAKIKVKYSNQDQVVADHLELVLEYPEGFYVTQTSQPPKTGSQNIWELAPLSPGAGGQLEITGQVVGKIGDLKKWQARLSYHPANINSSFAAVASLQNTIAEAILEGSVTAPNRVITNQSAVMHLNIRNATLASLKKLKVIWELPPGWKILSSDPVSTWPGIWLVAELLSQWEKQFTIITDKLSSGSYPWRVTVSQLGDNQTEQILYQNQGVVEVVSSQVNASLRLVQPTGSATWGQTVVLEATISNPTKAALGPVTMAINFAGQLIDWSKWQAIEGIIHKDKTLTWTAADLAPNQTRTQLITIPLVAKPIDIDLLDPEALILTATAKADYFIGDQNLTTANVSVTIPVAAGVNIFTQARYYADGQVVGAGSLPPQVGTSTSYRIYWKVLAGPGLTQAVAKTTLPPYINFEKIISNQSTGSFTFVSSTRQLVWQIGNLAANDFIGLNFLVSVIPQTSQANQLLILTQNTVLSGQETGTNKPVTMEASLLTSELVADKQAAGKGRVIP